MFRRTVQISVLVCSQNFSTQEPQAGTKMEGEDDLLTAKARGRGELGNREIVSRVSRALRLYSRVLLAYLRGVSVDRLRDSFCPLLDLTKWSTKCLQEDPCFFIFRGI